MNWLIIFHGILFILYCILMLMYRHWHNKLQPIVFEEDETTYTTFTIIIAARNEENNIGKLLQHLTNQKYPNQCYEIIVVDDFSTDRTATIVEDFAKKIPNIFLMQLSKVLNTERINSYKKKAIELAIEKSNYDWIITTDADCTMPHNWLQAYNNYIVQNNVVFVAAPVAFTTNGSWLHNFQQIDFMALQGITAAAVSVGMHAMCNGANVGYKKDVFYAVNGFTNIDTIASGDDMLLMNKIKKEYPNNLGYLYNKEAIVSTAPMNTVGEFINQRIRWASKTNKYKEPVTVIILWLVLIINFGLLFLPFLSFISINYLWYWLVLLFIKTTIESIFAIDIAKFFNIKLSVKYALLQYPHIVYTSATGVLSFIGVYSWKDRKVK